MVMAECINLLLTASLALLIYSWFKRKNVTVCLLRFCIISSLLLTPCIAESTGMRGMIGIPNPMSPPGFTTPTAVPNNDGPVFIIGVQGEYTGNPYEEQSAWMAGIEAFLNGTLINNFSNNTTLVA